MKLAEQPRLELLYNSMNLIIPFEKGQESVLTEFFGNIGQLDLNTEYAVKIEKMRGSRSHNANAYYFRLARQISAKMNVTLTEYHNRNLAELGIAWTDASNHKHWMLQPDDDFWLSLIEYHVCPTDRTEDRNGRTYRWFYLLKPSHEFDTKEMSRLIDSVVSDAKSLGIETLTPNELNHLKESWR